MEKFSYPFGIVKKIYTWEISLGFLNVILDGIPSSLPSSEDNTI